MPTLNTILVIIKLLDEDVDRIRSVVKNVYYYPDPSASIPNEELAEVEAIFSHPFTGIYSCIKSIDQLPKLRYVQNSATGVDRLLKSPIFQNASPDRLEQIQFANSAGGYSLNMGGFVLNYVTGLYNLIPSQIRWQANQKTWAEPADILGEAGLRGVYGSKTIYGKTFGFLGYGSLGREFARMCSIFPAARIIAANTRGERKSDDTYTLPGCGDTDAKLPEAFYSTSDSASLRQFLSETDVLVCSLPSTKHTMHLLDAEKLSLLKPGGLFINVGRGTLIKDVEILKALDAPNGLWGAAIDVTDPEPLPADSPLWGHKRLMITPHLSGETENEYTTSTDILLRNIENVNSGKPIFNSIDHVAGY